MSSLIVFINNIIKLIYLHDYLINIFNTLKSSHNKIFENFNNMTKPDLSVLRYFKEPFLFL